MNRLKFWIRPVTIFTVLGLIIGFVETGTTTVSDGKVIQSDSFSHWIGHVLLTMFAGLVLGAVIEIIVALVRKSSK